MSINHKFKNVTGEVSLSVGINNGRFFVKAVRVELYNKPVGKSVLKEVLLARNHDTEHVLLPMNIFYWDEFAHLIHAGVQSIDWRQMEVLLLDLQLHQLDEEVATIDHDVAVSLAARSRLIQNKEEIKAATNEGLFRKALNIASSVIFRLTPFH